MTKAPVILAPVRRHPELSEYDDDHLHLFADILGVDLIRDWDGALSTSIFDAWRIRQHLDSERDRKAQRDYITAARLELDDQLRLGPLRRRLDAQQRRLDAIAAINTVPTDQRQLDWEKRLNEVGDARFESMTPTPEVDTRTPLERLKAKEAR